MKISLLISFLCICFSGCGKNAQNESSLYWSSSKDIKNIVNNDNIKVTVRAQSLKDLGIHNEIMEKYGINHVSIQNIAPSDKKLYLATKTSQPLESPSFEDYHYFHAITMSSTSSNETPKIIFKDKPLAKCKTYRQGGCKEDVYIKAMKVVKGSDQTDLVVIFTSVYVQIFDEFGTLLATIRDEVHGKIADQVIIDRGNYQYGIYLLTTGEDDFTSGQKLKPQAIYIAFSSVQRSSDSENDISMSVRAIDLLNEHDDELDSESKVVVSSNFVYFLGKKYGDVITYVFDHQLEAQIENPDHSSEIFSTNEIYDIKTTDFSNAGAVAFKGFSVEKYIKKVTKEQQLWRQEIDIFERPTSSWGMIFQGLSSVASTLLNDMNLFMIGGGVSGVNEDLCRGSAESYCYGNVHAIIDAEDGQILFKSIEADPYSSEEYNWKPAISLKNFNYYKGSVYAVYRDWYIREYQIEK